jgi:hypothetical protein
VVTHACLTSGAAPAQGTSAPTAWSVLLSAVLPGGGQAVNGSSRAFAYLAVEAFAWASYTNHALEYRRRRNGYRQLAATVARAPFSDVRPDGDFAYYERMTHYAEAGRYDLIAGGSLDPETDTATYNGAVWLLARRTYWTDPFVTPDSLAPEWQRAVAFYRSRAYDELYRWSWTNAPLEYSRFLALIDESNADRLAELPVVATQDHALIRRWAERRRAEPATGEATESGPSTLVVNDDGTGIRFNFPGLGRFRPIAWDEWFRNFDTYSLVFVYERDDAQHSLSSRYRMVPMDALKRTVDLR